MRSCKQFGRIRMVLAATTALAALPLPALAQSVGGESASDDGEANRPAIAEIIVTAQKRSESANDVPLAITAMSGDQLRAAGVADPAGLDKVVPGFKVETTYTGIPIFFIRGVGFSDPAPIIAPTVSAYVDQVALPFSIMSRGAALDLERVEVLKGPQGTLFGRNSTGGAINFVAAKPTDELTAGANLSYGRFNSIELEGFISGPITPDLLFRVAGRIERQDGWQHSITRPDDTRGAKDFINGRATLDWTPSDRVHLRLTGQAWNDKSDLQGSRFTAFTPQVPVGGYQPAYDALAGKSPAPRDNRLADWDPTLETERDNRFRQIALEADVDLAEDIQLTSITAYTTTKVLHPNDLDGTEYSDLFNIVDVDIKSLYQELRLSGESGPVKWMVGGNYQREKTSDISRAFTGNTVSQPFGIHFPGVVNISTDTINTYSAFGGLDFALTDTVTARGSIRYTQSKDDHFACTADVGDSSLATIVSILSELFTGNPIAVPPGSCVTLDSTTFIPGPVVSTLDEDNISWRAGLDWKVTPDTLVYANIARGYKAGGYTNTGFNNSDQVNPVKQESVLAYEAGLKSSLADGRVQANLSAFYYDYKDKQLGGFVLIPLFGPLPTLVSIPKSRVYGSELEVDALITPTLRARLSGAYINTRANSDPTYASDPFGGPATFVGESFPQTAKYQASMDLEQMVPLSDELDMYLGGNLAYRSSASAQFGSQTSAFARSLLTIPDYATLDLRAGVRFNDGKAGVEIWGRNVTDKYYITSIVKASDTVMNFTGMPRTFGVRAFWRY